MKDETFRIRFEAKNPEKGHLRAYCTVTKIPETFPLVTH